MSSNILMFNHVQHNQDRGLKIHIGYSHPTEKNDSTTFVGGRHLYAGPTKQQTAVIRNKFASTSLHFFIQLILNF